SLWQAGAAQRRHLRHRRRALYPRLHPAAAQANRRRLRAKDAILRGQNLGRRHHRDRCLHQVARARGEHAMSGRNYLTVENSLRSWVLTTDHKRIAILFFATITLFFFVGGAAATLIRLELIEPRGLFFTSDEYNRLFTIHGVVMVWFFLIPSIPTTLGNFLVPMMIGAR